MSPALKATGYISYYSKYLEYIGSKYVSEAFR